MGRKSKEHSRNAKKESSSERKKKIKSIPQTQENVRVKDVQIIDKRRELDTKKVEALAASILMVGLRTPITVKRLEEECDGVSITVLALVAGGYRLEAFKSLQRSRIPAFVIEGDQNDARILQLTENLYRTDLTAFSTPKTWPRWSSLFKLTRVGKLPTLAASSRTTAVLIGPQKNSASAQEKCVARLI